MMSATIHGRGGSARQPRFRKCTQLAAEQVLLDFALLLYSLQQALGLVLHEWREEIHGSELGPLACNVAPWGSFYPPACRVGL